MQFTKGNQRRYEIKFVMNSKERNKFLKQNNLKTLYPDRIVESVYFDTRDLQFFNLSEEGVTPRLKVRIRGYNNGKLDNLEIKITKNYHREKIIFKNFEFDNFTLHEKLKKQGIRNIVEAKIKSDGLISSGSLNTGSHITSGSSSQIITDASNAIIRSIAPRLYSLQPFLLLSSRNPTIIANTTQLRIPINFQSNGTTRRLISTNIGINIMPPDMGFPILLSASMA